jgi:hypothetical protein
MFLRARYPAGVLLLALFSLGVVSLCGGSDAGVEPRDDTIAGGNVRNYRFTARIKANDGVQPFQVGKVITGTFRFDRDAKDRIAYHLLYGWFSSPHNALTFRLGELRFSGAGDVTATTSVFQASEHFQIVAFDLKLPTGWEMDHTVRAQSYGIVLQNVPSKWVLASKGLPEHLSLDRFSGTREFHLDFYHGVRFPGGEVKRRAVVSADVEKLVELPR